MNIHLHHHCGHSDDLLQHILEKLGALMARVDDVNALVAAQSAKIDALGTEVGELKTAAQAALAAWKDSGAATAAALDAALAENAALKAGALSDADMATLSAATDAAVAKADAAVAAANDAEAALDADRPPAA